jgi:hypothetical protein
MILYILLFSKLNILLEDGRKLEERINLEDISKLEDRRSI